MHYVFLFDLYRVSVSDVLLCQAMFSPQVVLRRPSIWSAKHWRHWRTQRPARGMTAAWPAKQCAKHGNGEHAALRLPKRKVQRRHRPTAARNPEGSQVLSQRHQISRSQKEQSVDENPWSTEAVASRCAEWCHYQPVLSKAAADSGEMDGRTAPRRARHPRSTSSDSLKCTGDGAKGWGTRWAAQT